MEISWIKNLTITRKVNEYDNIFNENWKIINYSSDIDNNEINFG